MNPPDSTRNPNPSAPPRITVNRLKTYSLVPVAILSALAVAAVLYRFDPAHHAFYPVCFFHQLTGLHCPGCGGLRALHHLTHGEILTAFHSNPLLFAALPFVGFIAFRWWKHGRAVANESLSKLAWTLLAVVLVFGVLRNLPGPAFAWMSP